MSNSLLCVRQLRKRAFLKRRTGLLPGYVGTIPWGFYGGPMLSLLFTTKAWQCDLPLTASSCTKLRPIGHGLCGDLVPNTPTERPLRRGGCTLLRYAKLPDSVLLFRSSTESSLHTTWIFEISGKWPVARWVPDEKARLPTHLRVGYKEVLKQKQYTVFFYLCLYFVCIPYVLFLFLLSTSLFSLEAVL